jgi:hypothetical protein
MEKLYLDKKNKINISNSVLSTLSKEDYNVNTNIKDLTNKIELIMNSICQNYKYEPNTVPQVQLQRLNEITINECVSNFKKFLNKYDNNNKNNDVENTYAQLLKERDLPNNNTNTTYNTVDNNSLPPIMEETLNKLDDRDQIFSTRLKEMVENRKKFLNDRNKVQLEMIEKNNRIQFGVSNGLPDNNSVFVSKLPEEEIDNRNDIRNIENPIVSREELKNHRYHDYRDENMKYKDSIIQFIINASNRMWYGTVENGIYNTGLEPYRYRFTISSSNQSGIYIQNRQKNVVLIRLINIFISIVELTDATDVYFSPYIYVYIPELENKVETSIPNRKYVFCSLIFDGLVGRQAKYINFISSNYYAINPLADLNNFTIEILAPNGKIISEVKDDYKIVKLEVDNLTTPKYLILTLDKYFKSIQFDVNDIILIKKYGESDNIVDQFTIFMNQETGHFLKSNPSTDEYLNKLYISVPLQLGFDGRPQTPIYFDNIIADMVAGTNKYENLRGYILNSTHQPTVLFEIGKIVIDNPSINQSSVTII